jgi:Ion channel
MRRIFFRALFHQIQVIWPVFSGIALIMIGLGLLIGYIEDWPVSDVLYFTFVTGLTIGYDDLIPKQVVSRFLSIVIAFAGITLTGLIAAVAVQALGATTGDGTD